MFEPEYMCPISLVDSRTKIMGNIGLANKIKSMARMCINQNKDLYHAQEEINSLLVKEFGKDWYEKSGEAVNFLIENEYSHKERETLCSFDMKQYTTDINRGILY